jgi:type II restriction enzyme
LNLRFDQSLADGYKSPSQRIRRMSEGWFVKATYCPACGNSFHPLPTNTKVSDVVCLGCVEKFQVKASSKTIGQRILDGSYKSMMKYLKENQSPGLMLMTYNSDVLAVRNLLAIPGHFVTATMIEKRRALSPKAKRHNYVGCMIRVGDVPESGRIYLVKNGSIINKRNVIELWKQNAFLKDISIESRGWMLDVWLCIDKMQKKEFTLDEAYNFETELKKKHPRNRFVRDKIRQVLQQLRDKDKLKFVSRGKYRLITR